MRTGLETGKVRRILFYSALENGLLIYNDRFVGSCLYIAALTGLAASGDAHQERGGGCADCFGPQRLPHILVVDGILYRLDLEVWFEGKDSASGMGLTEWPLPFPSALLPQLIVSLNFC